MRKKNKWLKLVSPDINEVNFEVCEEDLQDVDYLLYAKEKRMSSTEVWPTQNKHKRRQNASVVMSKYHNKLEQNLAVKSYKADELKEAMFKFNSQYSKVVFKTSELPAEFFWSKIEKIKDGEINEVTYYKIVSNYSRMNVSKTLKEFDRIANLKVKQSFSLDTPIFIELLQSNKDTFVILAESVFESYSRWWETKDLTKEEITRHRSKIKKRHEMIQ